MSRFYLMTPTRRVLISTLSQTLSALLLERQRSTPTISTLISLDSCAMSMTPAGRSGSERQKGEAMSVDVYDATLHTVIDRRDDNTEITVPHVAGRTWEKRPPNDIQAHVLWDEDEQVMAVDADWLDDQHGYVTRRDVLLWWLVEIRGEDRQYAISLIDDKHVEAKKSYFRYDPLSAENEYRIEHHCGHGGCRCAEDCSHNNPETRVQKITTIARGSQWDTPVWTECYPDEDGARDFWIFSWT